MKILLVGGGSGGPVTPLLAVAENIKTTHPQAEFVLVGTKTGPERLMAEAAEIKFVSIDAGKLRRYFSWKNFVDWFLVLRGFWQSRRILSEFKPDCIVGAGSFVQVPVIWAAWLKHIPVVLHQQDLQPSLANRLCAFAAKKISVVFQQSLTDFAEDWGLFYKHKRSFKTLLTGNPFAKKLLLGNKARAVETFHLQENFPTLLVLGGGTGAQFFNQIIAENLRALTKAVQIIHVTGAGKSAAPAQTNYHPYEFLANLADAYAAADIVLCRAGLSTITELSHLKKLAIIVPLPNSHQEINARLLKRLNAALVLEQSKITGQGLVSLIRRLLFEPEAQKILKENISKIMPKDADKKISELIVKEVIFYANGK